jgi:hypothetical protein
VMGRSELMDDGDWDLKVSGWLEIEMESKNYCFPRIKAAAGDVCLCDRLARSTL